MLKRIKLIGGKSRQGKDTFALYLKEAYEKKGYKVAITQISKYLKNYAMDYFDWDGKEETKPRKLLQELGTDIIREKLDMPLIFVNRTIEDLIILNEFFDVVIISDIRFPIEVEKVKEHFTSVESIEMIRPNHNELKKEETKHKTELALDDFKFDRVIINDKTLDELKEKAEELVANEKDD